MDKLLLCCKKKKPKLYNTFRYDIDYANQTINYECLNGKVLLECDYELEKVDFIKTEYIIHIKNIEVYEEPYEVSECWQRRKYNVHLKNIPQNMCEVYDKKGNPYFLISVDPEEMHEILIKEKTTLSGRNILKGMLNNG